MSYTVNPPEQPTHAINHVDNWDGQGDIHFSFVFICHDDYYHFETGKPVIEFQGDAILNIWVLNESTTNQ